MAAYYNETDKYAAQWLRNLMDAGHIAPGVVDERSIEDVAPSELVGFRQCHFFAGLGGWSYALRRAGWPDDRPVWTGSCPCQPFSKAGRRGGTLDERHLWPAFFHLIRECCPPTIFGEQVADASAHIWLDLVQDDMESVGYLVGALSLAACGFGAPHKRARLYWLGHSLLPGLEGHPGHGAGRGGWEGSPGSIGPASPPHRLEGWQPVMFAADCDPDGDGWCRVRDIDPAECECIGPTEEGVEYMEAGGELYGRRIPEVPERPGPLNGVWRAADWLHCTDKKWRAVEPGTFPLADGPATRVGRLRAYGNAIVPEVAAQFIAAYLESLNP